MNSTRLNRLPLFDRYAELASRVAWQTIGNWPTPITRADAFAKSVGVRSFFIKREDLSHPDCGGNKTRGLEFLIGRARERNADCLVTFSSAGSHHISKTAWHARQFGIDTIAAYVDQPVAEYVRRNMAAAIGCGARYIPANKLTVIPKVASAFVREKLRGRRACFVAPGGTSRRSMLGHVNAAFELKSQIDAGCMPTPDYIFVVMGSLGTAAGLGLGLKLAGLQSRVVGITVSYKWYCTRRRLARFARRVNNWMRRIDSSVPDTRMRRDDFHVVSTALGDGYALFTQRGEALARTLLETQGVRLDGTYTAKALDGAMQFIHDRNLADSTHLFWHTYFDFPPHSIPANQIPPSVRRYFDIPGQPWLID